jgi:nucleoside-diphosphate-sugar epimerase
MRIVVTGANGFLGTALCDALQRGGHDVVRCVRRTPAKNGVCVGEINGLTDWGGVFATPADAVIHLAAKTPESGFHLDRSGLANLYQTVNTEGTKKLALCAADRKVKRFIFISTAKVMGEGGPRVYTDTDCPDPQDDYAKSKYQAELELRRIELETGMPVVILRPPLVIGPGAKGNLQRLVQLVEKGIPLPLAMVTNRRSVITQSKLVDVIRLCIDSNVADGKSMLVADKMLSTPQLVRALAAAMGRRAVLFPVPPALLKALGSVFKRRREIDGLLTSFVVDGAEADRLLGRARSSRALARN